MASNSDGEVIIRTKLDTSGIEKSIADIKTAMSGLSDHLAAQSTSIAQSIGKLNESFNKVEQSVQQLTTEMPKMASSMDEKPLEEVADSLEHIHDEAEDLAKEATGEAEKASKGVGGALDSLAKRAADRAKDVADSVKRTGQYAISGGRGEVPGRIKAISDQVATKVQPMIPKEYNPIPLQYRLLASVLLKAGNASIDFAKKHLEANRAIDEGTRVLRNAETQTEEYAGVLRRGGEAAGEAGHQVFIDDDADPFRDWAQEAKEVEEADPLPQLTLEAQKLAEQGYKVTFRVKELNKTGGLLGGTFGRLRKAMTAPFDMLSKKASALKKKLVAVFTAPFKPLEKLRKTIKATLGKFLNYFGEIGQDIEGVLFLAGPLAKITEIGSTLTEVQNVVDVTFENMSESVNEFAKSALDSFGLSETVAKQFAGTLGAMAKSFGFAEKDAMNMAKSLTALAGDVASFYNMDQKEAFNKLKAVFTGETEGLKSLGIAMTQTALEEYALSKGITKSIQKMTEQEKVALRYNFVLEKLSGANGDFARTQDSWANQTRILKLQLESIFTSLGQAVINVFNPFIIAVNKALAGLSKLAEAFRNFTAQLRGGKVEETTSGEGAAAKAAGEAMGYLSDETENETEAMKKAEKEQKKYLSGLDEIARWSDKDDDDEGVSAQLPIEEFSPPEEAVEATEKQRTLLDDLIDRMKELAELFKKGFKIGLGGDFEEKLAQIKRNLQEIWEKLKSIFTDPAVMDAAKRFYDAWAYNLGLILGAVTSIFAGIVQVITGAINVFLAGYGEDIKRHLIAMFDIGADIANLFGSFAQAIAEILSPLWGPTAQNILANILGIIWDVWATVSETVMKLIDDLLHLVMDPIIENKDKLKEAIENTLQAIQPIIEGAKNLADRIKEAVTDLYDNHIHKFLTDVKNGVSKLVSLILTGYNTYIAPVLKKLGERAKEIMEGPLGELIENFIGLLGDLIDELDKLWNDTLMPFFTWIAENVGPVVGDIIDTLGNGLLDAVEWVIEKLNGLTTWCRQNETLLETVGALLVGLFAGWATTKTITMVIGVVKALAGFFSLKTLAGLFSGLGTVIGDVIALIGGPWSVAIGVVVAAAILIYRHWDDIKKFIDEKLIPTWNAFWDGLKDFGKYIKDTAIKTWEDFEKKIADLKEGFRTLKEEALMKIQDFIMGPLANAVKSAQEFFSDLWDNHLKGVWENIRDFFNPTLEGMKGFIDGIGTAIDSLKSVWGAAWDWIASKIDAVAGPINAVIEGISGAINSVLQGLANLLNANGQQINYTPPPASTPIANSYGTSFFNDGLVGAEPPLMAKGGVIPPNSPFLAILGDQKAGTNIEAPLATIEQAVRNVVGGSNGQRRGTKLTVVLDRKVLFDAMIDAGRDALVRTGNNAFEMG